MATQHTPGPWQVVKSWEDFMVEGPNGEEIIWQDGNYDTPTIKLEDARLIAAAPELLKQLKIARDEAVGWFDDSRGFDPKNPPDWLSGIDTAIAKATNA